MKLLVPEGDSAFYAEVEGEIVWSSQIVVTECFSALLRKRTTGGYARRQDGSALRYWQSLWIGLRGPVRG